MNKISSLIQIKMYKPMALHADTHKLLAKKLKFFTPDNEYRHLSYTYWFETTRYQSVLQKMSRIGWFADQICHHPQWKLMDKNLQVVISTHDIGNRISLKDYILAEFIELILQGKDIQKQLFEKWNRNKVILSQLSPETSVEQGKK